MVDTLAHALWSYIAFHKTSIKKKLSIWPAIFFGILPDLLSWAIYLIFLIATNDPRLGRLDVAEIPNWISLLYQISHSLVVFALVAGIVYILLKRIPLCLYAWPLHILIDIPTHSRELVPTPFLWPVSSWTFPGVSWATPWLFVLNWTLIAFCLGYMFHINQKQKSSRISIRKHPRKI